MFLSLTLLSQAPQKRPKEKAPLFGVRCISLLYHKQLNKPYTLDTDCWCERLKTNRVD